MTVQLVHIPQFFLMKKDNWSAGGPIVFVIMVPYWIVLIPSVTSPFFIVFYVLA